MTSNNLFDKVKNVNVQNVDSRNNIQNVTFGLIIPRERRGGVHRAGKSMLKKQNFKHLLSVFHFIG